jgi:methylenetetrahydrofolate dehydrogenase (NADP+) / methenyltetrahydrofolate cyclohydrolase
MQLIDGKVVSNFLQEQIAMQVNNLVEEGKKIPHLAAVLVGNDGASETYIASKEKACQRVGFKSSILRFESSITEEQLLKEIDGLNKNKDIDGFIIQLPLPKHINEQKVIESIDPKKDVDGFHPTSVGRMALNLPTYLPATPFGVIQLLDYYKIVLYLVVHILLVHL